MDDSAFLMTLDWHRVRSIYFGSAAVAFFVLLFASDELGSFPWQLLTSVIMAPIFAFFLTVLVIVLLSVPASAAVGIIGTVSLRSSAESIQRSASSSVDHSRFIGMSLT